MRVIWSAKEDMSSDGETEVAAPMTSSGDGTATVPSGDAAPKAIGAETVPMAASIPGAESDPSTSMAYRYRRDGSGRTATGDDVSTPRPRNRCPPASTDLAVTTAPSALFSFWPSWPAAPIPLEAGTKET
ncbi:UNVERIFIED_CONTAM: hypothetical protein K2H54_020748 [Gekko kuhli]